MKKIVAIIVAAILMITVFAACTKDKDSDDSQSDDPGISTAASDEVSPSAASEETREPVEREYSIPEDAIDISGLFEEEQATTEDASDIEGEMAGKVQQDKKAVTGGRS